MTLAEYARDIGRKAGVSIASGELFAKILTQNDDSGRHGVLIPTDVYSFFPHLEIPNPHDNATGYFRAFDVPGGEWGELAYKHYHRYPERRITKLNRAINRDSPRRLVVFLRGSLEGGESFYAVDHAIGDDAARLERLLFGELLSGDFRPDELPFGGTLESKPGIFIRREISAPALNMDATLVSLLERFDAIHARGWIDSMRAGDTGIGFTFESLLGIEENNDKIADYHGIEIKCSLAREHAGAGGKINLFQQSPDWRTTTTALARLRQLGRAGNDGLYACYSQVTAAPNNIGLRLQVQPDARIIELVKDAEAVGEWRYDTLEKRLQEKHSRAVFIKARSQKTRAGAQYRYEELVYCEHPKIDAFVKMVEAREIVFEFIMSEKAGGAVRNHGYPWRLNHGGLLERLFSLQVKLR